MTSLTEDLRRGNEYFLFFLFYFIFIFLNIFNFTLSALSLLTVHTGTHSSRLLASQWTRYCATELIGKLVYLIQG